MQTIINDLKNAGFSGEMENDPTTLNVYSHDASMFEIRPKLVVAPKNSKDVEILTKFVAKHKKHHPQLSLTARSAGTDMSGGAINDSIIVDFRRHLNEIEHVSHVNATVQPGVFYRDFDVETMKHDVLLPSYPASRDLCTLGGMVNNNSGGEKSLEYGKTDNYVIELEVVFSDGVKRIVKPLNRRELVKKMAQKDTEGRIYRHLFDLLEKNYELIQSAKPNVTKDSTGYHLWNVWNRETGVFDLTKAFVGAQGTLGLVTKARVNLVKRRKHNGLLVLFLRDTNDLGEIVPQLLKHKPATLECFDDATLLLGIKFFPSFLKTLGFKKWVKLGVNLIPDALQFLRGIPKLIVMVEFNGTSEEIVRRKVHQLHRELSHLKGRYEINGFEEDPTEGSAEKFWIMRRQSFQLLRSKVKDKHTAPFIDDFVVRPEHLPEFFPKIRKIIKKYKLLATIAGHLGDGNFHIIPLMKLEDPKDRMKLLPAMREVNNLVLKYGGSLSGEHNDGLVRGPWLEQMYGKEMMNIFKDTKQIFDPNNIFNPHKKADADWNYSFSHIRDKF
jgi:FAD/FMN-containing dehydrogenase